MIRLEAAAAPALLTTNWTIAELAAQLDAAPPSPTRRLDDLWFLTCGDDLGALRALQLRYEHLMDPASWAAVGDTDSWVAYAEARLLDVLAAAPPGSLIIVGDLGGLQHLVIDRLARRRLREAATGVGAGAALALPEVVTWRRQRQQTRLPPYPSRPAAAGGAPRGARQAMQRWGVPATAPDAQPGTALRLARAGVTPEALHAWDPLEPVLQAYDVTEDAPYLAAALAFAGDWLAAHMASAPAPGEAPRAAWLPPAVALRSARLAYLVEVLARQSAIPDAVVQFWLECLAAHRAVTGQDEGGRRRRKTRAHRSARAAARRRA